MSGIRSITLKQLRALTAINEFGTLTAAAKELNLTPPAVSTQLRLLEENCQTKLLLRGNDGNNRLTASGEEILRSTRLVESALTTGYERINSIRQGKSGFLAIGVVSTGKYFAPQLVSDFQTANPDIQVSLRIGNREDIISLVFEGAVDLAIMGRPPRAPNIASEILGAHPHIFIAPVGHHLATGCDVSPNALLEETFLTRERGSGTRILMERLLDRLGDGRIYATVGMGTNETIKQAVIAGLGIALISAHTVATELAEGRLVQIKAKGVPITRQWFITHRRDADLSAVAEKFRTYLIGLNGSYLPDIPD